MKRIPLELKESIIQKVLMEQGKGRTLRELADLHQIGYSTLHKWLKRSKDEASSKPLQKPTTPSKVSAAERFKHVLATASLDEKALGVYCREQGLYSHQIQQWKDSFMTQQPPAKDTALQAELKALRAENKILKKNLHRKDKALAETTALLILKKKAHLLWGGSEDD